jgi:hypothetical protein
MLSKLRVALAATILALAAASAVDGASAGYLDGRYGYNRARLLQCMSQEMVRRVSCGPRVVAAGIGGTSVVQPGRQDAKY